MNLALSLAVVVVVTSAPERASVSRYKPMLAFRQDWLAAQFPNRVKPHAELGRAIQAAADRARRMDEIRERIPRMIARGASQDEIRRQIDQNAREIAEIQAANQRDLDAVLQMQKRIKEWVNPDR